MCTQCIWDLQFFKTFQNSTLFSTFGFYEISTVVMRIMLTMANIVLIIISNIAHTVYIRFIAFWNFSKLQFVLHILAFRKFLLRWCAAWNLWWTLFKSSFPTLDTLCRLHLQCFQTFRNCCLFRAFWLIRNISSGDAHDANYCKYSLNHDFQYWTQCISDLQRFEIFRNSSFFSTFWLLRNFYCGDAHNANYCKRSLNNHFQYWTHGAYQIYSVFKLFETAVCSAPLGFYEVSTVVMRIMRTRANIV